MFTGLHVQWRLFLSDINETWIFLESQSLLLADQMHLIIQNLEAKIYVVRGLEL